jgi:putative acetyltransferase
MFTISRTDALDPDFIRLVRLLDAQLEVLDGDEHPFYDQFNKLDLIRHAVIAYDGQIPVGCGAIKAYTPGTMEVKRMYVEPAHRGKGIASRILAELESWARELLMDRCILETGVKQTEAIALYTKNGYQRIPNYGPYADVPNSVCFEKSL